MTSSADSPKHDPSHPDGDAVAQWIFSTGAADTFLSRELADGVLHFLQDDAAADVTDVAVRVIRELGYPRVALALGAKPFDAAGGEPGTEPGVYPSNLLAAQRLGLLRIDALEHVNHLTAGLVDPPQPDHELDWLESMSRMGNRYFEAVLLPDFGSVDGGIQRAITALQLGQRLAGRLLVVNLPGPPGATNGLPAPSLFPDDDGETERALALLDYWPGSSASIRWRWHIPRDRPFLVNDDSRLHAVCRAALRLKNWQFVVDSPGRLPDLGYGVTAAEPAVLQVVHADLVGLRRHVGDDVHNLDQFLPKVASLARLSLAVGHAKRRHLRRRGPPGVRGAFILERSQLALTLQGLESVAREFAAGTDERRRIAISRQLRRAFADALAADPAGERWSLDRVGDNTPDVISIGPHAAGSLDELTRRLRRAVGCV